MTDFDQISQLLLVQATVLISSTAIIWGIQGLVYKKSMMAGNYKMTSWLLIYAGAMVILMAVFKYVLYGHL